MSFANTEPTKTFTPAILVRLTTEERIAIMAASRKHRAKSMQEWCRDVLLKAAGVVTSKGGE